MDLGTAISVAQTLNDVLHTSGLDELWSSISGYKQEIETLQRTVSIVKAVLEEAESKQLAQLSRGAREYVYQLKDVVFEADDLFDEFLTRAEQNKLVEGDTIFQKLRLLVSRFKSLAIAYKVFQDVKDIRVRLDGIANDYQKFGFNLDHQPIRTRSIETCSHLYSRDDIIGRQGDLDTIVRMLLDTEDQRDHGSCLSIVGMGGLGKTALAKLVYNDPRIQAEFSLKLWTCVSDQDPKRLDVQATLRKILHSATAENHDGLALQHLNEKVRDKLDCHKYLLVLDDVWNENPNDWRSLAEYLKVGLEGSWIVVTTRSAETARVVRGVIYPLKGLSEDDSWSLFERAAFGQEKDPELVKIGKKVVERCKNVPLAIKVVGTLLYGQSHEKWQSVLEVGIANIEKSGIELILKLSYDNLEPPLKTCFSFCALFPKDFVMKKELLTSLWMAQGYVVPLVTGQKIEDAAEDYFSTLLKRCFFQDLEKDKWGEISFCKIHDLMHDIAQNVTGGEIHVANSVPSELDDKIRHLSWLGVPACRSTRIVFPETKIRTYLYVGDAYNEEKGKVDIDSLICNSKRLRVLDLSHTKLEIVPDTLGRLLHLRYLDLSCNSDIQILPKSITKLYNLQTLNLEDCSSLRELPKDLSKLKKLRELNISGCELHYMPRGMEMLDELQKLSDFVVGERASDEFGQSVVDQIEEIKALQRLHGRLDISIRVPRNAKCATEDVTKGGCLSQHLMWISIKFAGEYEDEPTMHEALMENLKLHPRLKELNLENYKGGRMPSWARGDSLAISLPNLVHLLLWDCPNLQHLSGVEKLPNLKWLQLFHLSNLEYVVNCRYPSNSSGAKALESEASFFPSLELLNLSGLDKMEGWWRDDDFESNQQTPLFPSFPRLSRLSIEDCPNLTYLPTSPVVEEISLQGKFSEMLGVMPSFESGSSRLRRLQTSKLRHLKSTWPIEAFRCLVELEILGPDQEIERLLEVEDVFRSCSISLQVLKIYTSHYLKSLRGGLEHLTALREIEFSCLSSLDLRNVLGDEREEEEEDDGMPWPCLQHTLRKLVLRDLPKLVKLPKWMRHLTALQSVRINCCSNLESIPDWMRQLTSLQHLEIAFCSSSVTQRCQEGGEDWPNIQHIPGCHIYS